MKKTSDSVLGVVLFVSLLTHLSLNAAAKAAEPTGSAAGAGTGAGKAVSAEKYNSLVKYVKALNERLKKLESGGVKAGPTAGEEETVDLSQDGGGKTAEGTTSGTPAKVHGGRPAFAPSFHVYFDLNLIHRPGFDPLTFDSFHNFLLFEMAPTPEFQFSFDVNPSPQYFELDYQFAKKFTLRAGKIWIPFDDMAPHNIFGGRVNVSRLLPRGGAAYLPDLWTDLGLGLKWQIVDSSALTLVSHVYVVNGFRSGGTDPLALVSEYPSFGALPTGADNNDDKAFGARIHGTLFQTLSLGASVYSGRWSDQEDDSKGLLIWGTDAQLRFAKTELRTGLSGMNATLSDDYVARGGFYGEFGQKFGGKNQFKFLLRGGALQLDDRAIDINDRTLVGATVLYQPGPIQISIEHSRDLNTDVEKTDVQFTSIRLVVAL